MSLTVEQRIALGKKLRERVTRSAHGDWKPSPRRADPLALLRRSDQGRLEALLPIRYQRMRQSPFAFLRGAAAVMAADLATTAATGLQVQACGDCHVANFGGFGTPERQLVFDINDFDETLPAPWEWDLKRLAASVLVATRVAGLNERDCRDKARAAAEAYRTRMDHYAAMPVIDLWYSHMDLSVLAEQAPSAAARKRWLRVIAAAARRTPGREFPKITTRRRGKPRIADHPPLIYHPREKVLLGRHAKHILRRYRETLAPERRIMLDRYELVDVARKVVGVGSVGTRCAVALLMAERNDPLFLQFKEARRSVLEPYTAKSRFANQGERVVVGQRMLQCVSDICLGWTRDDNGHDYYLRQLHDMKLKVDLEAMSHGDWSEYIELCGWALAHAHARTGDPARLAGYMGKSDAFDEAIERFAVTYADVTEKDYEQMKRSGIGRTA